MNLQSERIALISELISRHSGKTGRTALMKLCYFLQILRSVPLHYRFSLYSYGPFDSEVLADLDSAEALGAVRSQVVTYQGGYGYELTTGQHSKALREKHEKVIRKYSSDIDWVLEHFGSLWSYELELLSTTVFVDRAAARSETRLPLRRLVAEVHEIKPHFTEEDIERRARELKAAGILVGTT